MSIGARVKELRTAKGWSQAELAREVGVSQQMIFQLESGQTERTRHVVEIARALGTTPEDLQGISAVRGGVVPAAPPPFSSQMRDVPVYGQVVGGDGDSGADFEFNGQTIDYLRRPSGIAMMRDVFGLYITGSSMFPKFEEGEPIYVSAARPPAIGDYVVIELYPTEEGSNGPGYIKRLKRRTPTKIVCEQFNPPKDIEFDREEIKSIFRVIPLIELVGA